MADPLDSAPDILRGCADSAPGAWFPSSYAKATGADRDSLDEALGALRIAGLVRIADWQQGVGQGYELTDAGRAVLDSPRALDRLRRGRLPAAATAPPEAEERGTAWERGEAVRMALMSRSLGPVTKSLMAAQFFVFIAGLFFAQQAGIPPNEYLRIGAGPVIERLAVSVPALAQGEWWRLISYCFVHVGALHLLLNLYGHYLDGSVVEGMFGRTRFLILWVLSGFGGGCAAVLFQPDAPAAGSSGAWCGMVGAQLAFIALNRQHLSGQMLDAWKRHLTSIIVLTVLISLSPRISWAGHLGGAVVGLIAGGLLNYQRFGTFWQRVGSTVALALVPLACVGALARFSPLATVRQAAGEAKAISVAEAEDFDKQVVTAVDRATDLADTVIKNVMPVVQTPHQRRAPDALRDAREHLVRLRPDLTAALQVVAKAGPYRTEFVESARRAAGKLLDAQVHYTNLLEQSLRADGGAAPDQTALIQADEERRSRKREWNALFR